MRQQTKAEVETRWRDFSGWLLCKAPATRARRVFVEQIFHVRLSPNWIFYFSLLTMLNKRLWKAEKLMRVACCWWCKIKLIIPFTQMKEKLLWKLARFIERCTRRPTKNLNMVSRTVKVSQLHRRCSDVIWRCSKSNFLSTENNKTVHQMF